MTDQELQPFGYVTYVAETGALIGSFFQVLLPEHENCHIVVDEETRANWTAYRANAARDGVEIAPPTIDLAAERAKKWNAIKAERDRIKRGGVEVDGHWFHSDDSSRIQQLGLVLMGASVPAVQWKTMNGAFVPMTQALAQAIFDAVVGLDQAAFGNAEAQRVTMEASADPANYDFSGGWQTVYVDV